MAEDFGPGYRPFLGPASDFPFPSDFDLFEGGRGGIVGRCEDERLLRDDDPDDEGLCFAKDSRAVFSVELW